MNDFKSTATMETLKARAEILKQVRNFFDSRDFFEVETPLLSADVVVDRHIEPIQIPSNAIVSTPIKQDSFWLQTSPEFAMKRLLVSGAKSIYQIAKAFRFGEAGSMHNPEFTMLEWYRTGDDYAAGRSLLADFASRFFDASQVEQVAYREAFISTVGLCPLTCPLDKLVQKARTLEPSICFESDDRDEVLNYLLSFVVEPTLGLESPTIVFDFPGSQSALAKTRTIELEGNEVEVAERFELYWKGIELANGYHELLDPTVLEERNSIVNRQRDVDGKPKLPSDSRLLKAMHAGLPSCSGVALGLDRLVMTLLDLKKISDVIPFPIGRA